MQRRERSPGRSDARRSDQGAETARGRHNDNRDDASDHGGAYDGDGCCDERTRQRRDGRPERSDTRRGDQRAGRAQRGHEQEETIATAARTNMITCSPCTHERSAGQEALVNTCARTQPRGSKHRSHSELVSGTSEETRSHTCRCPIFREMQPHRLGRGPPHAAAAASPQHGTPPKTDKQLARRP